MRVYQLVKNLGLMFVFLGVGFAALAYFPARIAASFIVTGGMWMLGLGSALEWGSFRTALFQLFTSGVALALTFAASTWFPLRDRKIAWSVGVLAGYVAIGSFLSIVEIRTNGWHSWPIIDLALYGFVTSGLVSLLRSDVRELL
ncbi:MAG: hypothetical protein GC208_00825 [Alphaproteobacteria bacterium]|nr:hypothetical protein [Alphaproteobacteria bacterium]